MKRVIWILILFFLVLSPNVNAVNEILEADRSFTVASTDGGSGMCYSRSNNTIFSADHDTPSISQFAPDGTLLGTAFSTLPQNNQPDKGIWCNNTHLLVPDGEVGGQVQIWTQTGTFLENIDLSANTPTIRAISNGPNQSYMYLRDNTNTEIDEYVKSTTTSGWTFTRSFSIPNLGGDSSRCFTVVNTSQGYYIFIGLGNRNDGAAIINVSRYNLSGNFGTYDNYGKRESHVVFEAGYYACAANVTSNGSIQFFYLNESNLKIYQASLDVSVSASTPDTTPPSITYYNLTSSTNGCESWNTDKNTACSTSSVVPAVQFNTSENTWCAIAGSSSSSLLDKNYTDMGNSRNCTGAASGEGTREHFCTLTSQDEIVYDTSYLFISCKDSSNNQNSTSTSGPLKLSITGLETARRDSIGIAIQNALLSGYTNYTDLQIYARDLFNNQSRGTFDRAAKKGNKMWAFNGIGVSDSHVNMFNLTPVLYNLEFANTTSARITNLTELMINATK